MTGLRLVNLLAKLARKLWRADFARFEQRVVVCRDAEQEFTRLLQREMTLNAIPVGGNPRNVCAVVTKLCACSGFERVQVADLIRCLAVRRVCGFLGKKLKVERVERHGAPRDFPWFSKQTRSLQVADDSRRKRLEPEQLVNQLEFHRVAVSPQRELRRLRMSFPSFLPVRLISTRLGAIGQVALDANLVEDVLKQLAVGIEFRIKQSAADAEQSEMRGVAIQADITDRVNGSGCLDS